MALRIELADKPPREDVEAVMRGLSEFNRKRLGGGQDWAGLTVLLRDGSRVRGGLLGFTHWDWLFVQFLWVEEALRGRDWGTRMMTMAEDEARRRDCVGIHLDTMSFQARGFYDKLGYKLFGELADFPRGHRRYFLWKPLTASA